MINKGKYFLSVFVLMLIAVFNLTADDDLGLNSGICLFEYDNAADSSIANGVSSAFFETARLITEHQLKPEEIKSLLTKSRHVQVLEKQIELEKLYSDRDKIIFSSSDVDLSEKLYKQDEVIKKKKLELSVIEDEITELEDGITQDLSTAAPVAFTQPDDGRYFTREAGPISETAEKNNIDFLIYGIIERLDDYRFIEVRLWNNLLHIDSAVWRTAVSSEDVNSLLLEGQKLIKSKLIGREWAELTVNGPDNSLIYIDGSFSGIGRITSLLTKPGEVKVKVRKNGYETQLKTVNLSADTETVLDFQLINKENRTIVIQTFPSEAEIYLDSVWIGLSPVRFEPETKTSAIRIKKAGYVDKNFFIDKDTEQIVNINLKADSSGRSQWVPDSRKRFYNGFGTFILSIPFTALFYSMVEQTGDAYQREYTANGTDNLDELIRLENLNVAQYSMYLASLGLNIFMFLDTIIHAVEYVSSVDYFSF